MSGPTGATDTAATAAEKDARFFLAVCQNALDDLAAVSRLAAEHNWKSMVDPRFPESKPEWVDGMWRVNRDDRSYTVGTGSAPKGIKYCSVAFGEPRASRDDFVVIVAESLRLTALDDTGASDLRQSVSAGSGPSNRDRAIPSDRIRRRSCRESPCTAGRRLRPCAAARRRHPPGPATTPSPALPTTRTPCRRRTTAPHAGRR
jgi:hypothetical protein